MNEEQQAKIADFIRTMVTPLMEPSDQGHPLRVSYALVSERHEFTVEVPTPSMRFVLGREGRNADAIRVLVKAAAATARVRGSVGVQIRGVEKIS